MRKKQPVPFAKKFPNADPLALKLLERLLAFDPKDRPTAEEVFILATVIYCFIFLMIIKFYYKDISNNNNYYYYLARIAEENTQHNEPLRQCIGHYERGITLGNHIIRHEIPSLQGYQLRYITTRYKRWDNCHNVTSVHLSEPYVFYVDFG